LAAARKGAKRAGAAPSWLQQELRLPPPEAESEFKKKLGAALRQLRPARWRASSPHPVLAEALGRWTDAPSDIHDHLGTLFAEAVGAAPRLIVELGTRGAVSTRALLAAAEVTGAVVLSVDIADCSQLDMAERFRARWNFALADDIAFAGAPFEAFCAARGLPPRAEVIFIDTAHTYEHTREELAHWLPRLAPGGVMMFHDTNMADGWFRRLDGVVSRGWDNERGVVRAVEEQFGRAWDERTFFVDVAGGFLVRHTPWSSGFTVLRRLAGEPAGA
jgi:predicted O-methyltransferase YrrM